VILFVESFLFLDPSTDICHDDFLTCLDVPDSVGHDFDLSVKGKLKFDF